MKIFRHLLHVFQFSASLFGAATMLPAAPASGLVNGSFEAGLEGWTCGPDDKGISQISTARAATGTHSLFIRDTDGKSGSDVLSSRVSVVQRAYELRGKGYTVSGQGLGIYIRELDAKGNRVKQPKDTLVSPSPKTGVWRPFKLEFLPQPTTAFIQVWIHSFGANQVEAFLDDLEFIPITAQSIAPPWTPQYKIKPEDKSRQTPADVVGPDGIVYPNWTRTGVQGGIPKVKEVVKLDDFGVSPNSGKDIAGALEKAVQTASAKGGGAIVFSAGTYYLDRPVTIRENGIVLRGQGMDRTRVIFRYAMPKNGAVFYWPKPNARTGINIPFELHCLPQGLMKMRITADGDIPLGSWQRSQHSGNTFMSRTSTGAIAKLADGSHKLTGIGEYQDGRTRSTEITFTLDRSLKNEQLPSSQVAICFQGSGPVGSPLKLARDGRRGDLQLELVSAAGLAAGDTIVLEGPATERWKTLTQNKCEWGTYRRYYLRVEKVDGKQIFVNQPLRIEFPTVDGSFVQKIAVLQGCGMEDMYLEQTEDLWITTVSFDYAWNCWARGVKVRKCGRNPVYAHNAKWCEIRDCVFDDAWYKGGGGTAYVGWELVSDCLMENVETFKFRHAPLMQWAASGCVIRKGVFHDSDAQWHSGWTHENLFEQCIIKSVSGNGGYGFGMWASPPEDSAHGPNGPRNVIYNCDVSSIKDGLWMGGMNENWIVAYNRFSVQKGAGVTMKTFSFDHIIQGNVFDLKDARSPMVLLQTPNCSGVEIRTNQLSGGSGQFFGGSGKPLSEVGNQKSDTATPSRPNPTVPSIYEWQQRNFMVKP